MLSWYLNVYGYVKACFNLFYCAINSLNTIITVSIFICKEPKGCNQEVLNSKQRAAKYVSFSLLLGKEKQTCKFLVQLKNCVPCLSNVNSAG
jgi:hypothetical protein